MLFCSTITSLCHVVGTHNLHNQARSAQDCRRRRRWWWVQMELEQYTTAPHIALRMLYHHAPIDSAALLLWVLVVA